MKNVVKVTAIITIVVLLVSLFLLIGLVFSAPQGDGMEVGSFLPVVCGGGELMETPRPTSTPGPGPGTATPRPTSTPGPGPGTGTGTPTPPSRPNGAG